MRRLLRRARDDAALIVQGILLVLGVASFGICAGLGVDASDLSVVAGIAGLLCLGVALLIAIQKYL